MNKITFSIESKRSFPVSDWPWLLLAIRQEPLVWNALQDEEFSGHAFSKLGSSASAWSPAALALLTLENPPDVESLCSKPLKPLPQSISILVRQTFENWKETPQAPDRLQIAGLLALNFREQFRNGVSWKNMLAFDDMERGALFSVISCLYGMIPEPEALLKALIHENSSEWAKIAVHALLSNPQAPEIQLVMLDNLTAGETSEVVQNLLQLVAANRPQLAEVLAEQILKRSTGQPSNETDGEESQIGIQQLRQLIQTLQTSRIQEAAGQSEMAVTALADSLRTVRHVRGHLSARLAGSIEGTKTITASGSGPTAHEASLEAWKQAVQLVPNEPIYLAGYARALQNLGRTEEALKLIEEYISDGGHGLHPVLMLNYAEALFQLRNRETALQAARDALDLFLENSDLTEKDAVRLVNLFVRANDPSSALMAVQKGLEYYSGSRDLLAISAKLQLENGCPGSAALDAIASQAAAVFRARPLPVSSADAGVFIDTLSGTAADTWTDNSTQQVLINSLEALQAWESAYQERISLLEGKPVVSKEENLALARCASGAGRHEVAAEICHGIIKDEPNNAMAHGLLGKACEAGGDYLSAIDHFNQAIEIAPEDVSLWKGLVSAYRKSGKQNSAFETLRSASQALPEDPEIQLQLGEQYLDQGAPSLALPYLKRAYALRSADTESGIIAARLGETLQKLGQLDEARQIIEPEFKRIENAAENNRVRDGNTLVSPELAHAYARILLAEKAADLAVPILTRIVGNDTRNVNAVIDLSNGLLQMADRQGGAKRAIPFLKQLLEDPTNSPDYLATEREAFSPQQRAEMQTLLAEAYSAAGDWDMALKTYKKAMEEPANQDAEKQTRLSLGLGLTALKLELPEMAVAALQEAAHVQPLNGDVQRSLSDAYLANGLSKDAFQSASAALELAPADIDTLTWFINQGLKIASLPGVSMAAVHADLIQALKNALQLFPERADFLFQLGSLLLQAGKRAEAIDTIKKLAAVDTNAYKITAAGMYKLGLEMLNLSESRLAAELFQKAIDSWTDQNPGNKHTLDGISLGEIYEALVKAFENLGDLTKALETVEKALGLEDASAALHLCKAEILMKLDQNEAARQTLDAGLARWPDYVHFYHAMSRCQRNLGDVPAALVQAEAGIAVMQRTGNRLIEKELYNLAAKFAYAALRPRRAYDYFQKAIPADDPDFNRYDNTIFRAELALEAGEVQAAEQAVDQFGQQAAETPRAMAACGRLACRQGDRETADKKCRSAVRTWLKLQQDQPGSTPATSPDEFMAELTAIGMAALENRQWAEALSIFRQMVVMFPDSPLANFKLMQALLICAEAQAICQDFDVVKRAPGQDSLLEATYQQFEKYLKAAAKGVGSEETASPEGAINESDIEIKKAIGLSGCRGRACFLPVFANAEALERFLQTMVPETADISALVMTFRRCGAKNRARRAVKVGWQPVFEGPDPREEPEVLAQIALAEDSANLAIKNAIEAIAAAEKRGYVWPDLPMLEYLLASLQLQAADYDAAQQAIEKALSLWPDEPRWKALAARIKMESPSSNQPQQLSEATGLLEQAVDLEPEHSPHYLELGKLYLQSNQTKRALQALEQAARLSPSDSAAWLYLAKVQDLRGETEEAALSAEKAVETSDEPLEASCLRAGIAIKAGNYRAGMNWAQEILQSHPDHPEAVHLLAKSLAGLERPEAAIQAMDKAIELSEQPISLQVERLELIKRLKGLEAGLESLQELVAQQPKQAIYLALLAGWLQEADKKESAIQAARLALQEGMEGLTAKQRADLHILIGLQMREQGQLDQSIHHLCEAVSLSSDHVDAYLELGKVYQERREAQQALKIYQKAISVAGTDYRPYYQAGLVLKDNKDYMAAEAMLRRAAQLAPSEVAVHRMLGAVVALNLVHNRRLASGEPRNLKL